MGAGDEWKADGETGDGARHRTRFRVVRTPGEGKLEVSFTRALAGTGDEQADYHGKLLYDAFRVVPLGSAPRARSTPPRPASPAPTTSAWR